MEILWIIALLILILSIKGFYDKKQERKQLFTNLAENFGCLPETEYTEEKYKSLQFYYKNAEKIEEEPCFYLDDVTWNDLNMDTLFCMINNTGSAMGEEVLYAMLRKLELSKDPLQKKEDVIFFC